jgi:hypothetical protein
MAETQAQMGLMLADDDGNVYYLRPELLQQVMVPADMAQQALKEVKHEGKAGRKNYRVLGSVEAKSQLAEGGGEKSLMATALPSRTIMCPW